MLKPELWRQGRRTVAPRVAERESVGGGFLNDGQLVQSGQESLLQYQDEIRRAMHEPVTRFRNSVKFCVRSHILERSAETRRPCAESSLTRFLFVVTLPQPPNTKPLLCTRPCVSYVIPSNQSASLLWSTCTIMPTMPHY